MMVLRIELPTIIDVQMNNEAKSTKVIVDLQKVNKWTTLQDNPKMPFTCHPKFFSRAVTRGAKRIVPAPDPHVEMPEIRKH